MLRPSVRFIYNAVFFLGFWLSAPFYFIKMWRRGGWRADFGQRWGRYDQALAEAVRGRPVLWLHAVSMGEVGIALPLVAALEERLPGWQMVVSTTTSTGMGELQKRLPPSAIRIYYPFDFPGPVRRVLDALRPRAIVLVEADLWPNLIWQAADRDIPLFLANTRISEKSFRGYRRFALLFRPIFQRFRGAGCQETDAGKLIELGFPQTSVQVTGNLKFDAAHSAPPASLDAAGLLRHLGVPPGAPILVAGSTHAGEEALLSDLFLRLRQKFPDLFLVLAPRHFERTRDVAQELTKRAVPFVLRSETSLDKPPPGARPSCLVVNTNGELRFFYETASVVFVGKSLTARGGQNPIEPAALGKAVVFGPNMQNFGSVVRAYLAEGAVLQVADAAALERTLAELLADPSRRAALGARALAVTKKNLGATARTADLILSRLTV